MIDCCYVALVYIHGIAFSYKEQYSEIVTHVIPTFGRHFFIIHKLVKW